MPVIRTETFAPAALWPRSLLVALLGGSSLALLGACSPDAIPTATTVTPASGSAAAAEPGAAVPGSPASLSVQAAAPASDAPVLLLARGATGTFMGATSCMVNFQTTNRGALPLVVFSGSVVPVMSGSGQKLEAVGMASVGVAGLSPEEPLVPQAQGKPWPVHVKGASCDQVRIRFDRFLCSFAGQPCGAVAVEQQGLAGIEPPVLARK